MYYIPVLNIATEPVYSFLKRSVLDFNVIIFTGHITIFIFFLFIIGLSVFARRFWCRSLCPLGAIYALTSSKALFSRVVNPEKCTSCLKCQQECRMDAIYDEGLGVKQNECILCFDCIRSCEYDAIEFRFSLPFRKKTDIPEPVKSSNGLPRKEFIAGIFSSMILLPVFKLNAGWKKDHEFIIRPPGALPENEFLDRCIRCSECMKICPTNALHPCLTEAGIEASFTPRLIPKMGYCEKNCILCSTICPTDALRKIKIADKETEIIGTAYIITDLCIPYTENRNCLVCEEMCPTKTKAIKLIEKTVTNEEGKKLKIKQPYVIENLCIGCGICENKCPIAGAAAIRVRTPKIPADEI